MRDDEVLGARARRGLPLALRRMRVHRIVLVAVAVTVAITASFAAALIMYSSQAANAAVHSSLGKSSGTTIAFSGAMPTQPTAQASATIRSDVSTALGGVDVTLYAAPGIDLDLAGSTQALHKSTTLFAPQGLAAHAKLVAGSWPGARVDGDVPVALNRAAAAALGVAPGSHITGVTDNSATVTVVVTGVFTPIDPSGAYWGLDPLAGAGIQQGSGYSTLGPLFTSASYLGSGPLAAELMEWQAIPDTQAIGASDLAARAAALGTLLSKLGTDDALGHLGATTRLPQLLQSLAPAAMAAQSLVYAELLELLVVAIAALFIVVRLLSEVRETEAALLWARGSSGPQLIRLRAAESVLLAAPAVIAAPLVAGPLAGVIARLGGRGVTLPHESLPPAVWAGVAGCALAAIAVMLAPAFGSAISPTALRAQRGRQAAVTAVGRAGFDLALLALAGLACWQLISTDSIVGTDQSGNATYSPVAIAAPALTLAAGAALALRLLPLAARAGERLTRRARALAVPLAFWQTGRRPLKLAGPVLLTMLAVAAGVLSLSEFASSERSAADQAAFAVGADADARTTVGTLSAADLGVLAAAPGVHGVSPLFRSAFVPDGGELSTTLLALDPASAERMVTLRPDLASVPMSTLMKDLDGPVGADGAIPAIATADLTHTLHLKVGDLTSVPVGSDDLRVRIVAVVSGFPTISSAGGGLVVSNTTEKLAPNEAWLSDSSTETPRGLPDSVVVTFRSQVQQQLHSAPLTEDSLKALLAVALATTLLALCGLVVSVLSSGAERTAEFALLDALGFSRRGRITTLCLEQLLLAGPGALAGIALGLLLGRVVIPVATLTAAAAKPDPPVTILTPWPQVVLGVVALLALPLITFAIAGARRRDTAAVLREGAGR